MSNRECQSTPIPHLIDAVNALTQALTVVTTLTADGPSGPARQDGLEHLFEVELLTELLNRHFSLELSEMPTL